MVLLIVHGISEKFSNMQLAEYVEISTNVTINIKSLFMWRCKKHLLATVNQKVPNISQSTVETHLRYDSMSNKNIIRLHHYEKHKMWPTATDLVWSVCVCWSQLQAL